MGIVSAVVITFFLTVLWQMWASRANKLPLRAVINALTNELDMMAEKIRVRKYHRLLERNKRG
ncbi:hypothetical protein SD71_19615 [Cohnella kolymensis]|uniref:Uncharacterized protein n=1 Tax=Cohnella kolymensis TaxID=1590652 RepID=A0ABR5A0J4_9BACL|nr:hypothetical protein SD71_19615 [Cohnella kolymensis]